MYLTKAAMLPTKARPEPARNHAVCQNGAGTAKASEAPVSPDGTRTVRYSKNGGSVMPTLDLFLKRIESRTRATRTTYNAICLVVAGEGRSTIGEQRFEWSRHDVFTVPHWTWASHEARSASADLFIVTDRAIYERLDLLKEELR